MITSPTGLTLIIRPLHLRILTACSRNIIDSFLAPLLATRKYTIILMPKLT